MVADNSASRVGRARAQLTTVRVRMTLGAVAVVGLALLVGSMTLVVVLRDTLAENVRSVAEVKADDVAAVIRSGGSAAEAVAAAPADPDEQFVQVLDAGGRILGSSENVASLGPIPAPPLEASSEFQMPGEQGGTFLVVATPAVGPGAPSLVIVGRTLDDVQASTEALIALLFVALPALLAIVAITIWKIVGRALAPVEAIRAEVDEISAKGLDRRVPEPVARDEIGRLASTMNRMLGRLEEAQTRQRRFVSDASHELRSPVATIRQHAEVALAHPDRTSIRELAETVLAEDLRIQRLVEDLLLLARADERTLTAGDQAVDLDDIVLDEIARLRDTTGLEIDGRAVSAGRVRGDPTQLRRMVRNLVENAARHARSRIAFSLGEREDGFVVLSIDDDGAGIRVDDRQRMFERFVRLDEGRAHDDGGSGLGLAIVAEVAALHGGTVVGTEAPGGGARLEVRLPLLAD